MATQVLRQPLLSLLRLLGLYHPLRDWRRDHRFRKESAPLVARWAAAGRPVPMPDLCKYDTIRDYARRHCCEILVETGTWLGNAIFTLRHTFREIHSIELADGLHRDAAQQFVHLSHIHLHHGDSATELPRVVEQLSGSILYWLDGHYCEGPSARGRHDSPIVAEMRYLLARPPRNDVVLIDDARYFTGERGYPTVDELRQLVARHRPDATFELKEDIFRIAPV